MAERVLREVWDCASDEWIVPAASVAKALDNLAAYIDLTTSSMGGRERVAISADALRHYAHFARRYAASLRNDKVTP